jgi:telomerase Cajal body protein 1
MDVDAIGSVGFHSFYPLLLSVSGSRHFELDQRIGPSDSDSSSEDSNKELDRGMRKQILNPFSKDPLVKVWLGNQS